MKKNLAKLLTLTLIIINTFSFNVFRLDYSFALEKLHPGTAGNDDIFYDPDLRLQQRKGNKFHFIALREHIFQK